jgi:hypothetical protein
LGLGVFQRLYRPDAVRCRLGRLARHGRLGARPAAGHQHDLSRRLIGQDQLASWRKRLI